MKDWILRYMLGNWCVDWLERHAKLQTHESFLNLVLMIDIQVFLLSTSWLCCLHGKHFLSVASFEENALGKLNFQDRRSRIGKIDPHLCLWILWSIPNLSHLFCVQGFDVLGASCSGDPWVVGAFVGTTGKGTQGISHAQPGCFGPGRAAVKSEFDGWCDSVTFWEKKKPQGTHVQIEGVVYL